MSTQTGRGQKRSRSGVAKKQSGGNRRMTVPRNRLNFPQSLRTRMRYVTRVEFTPTSTSAIVRTIRANDLFDPEFAVGGHQPRGFDEMMEVYGKYTVMGSKVSATFMYEGYTGPSETGSAGHLIQTLSSSAGSPPETPALPPIACGIHTGTENLATGTAEEQMEKERTTWGYISPSSGVVTRTASATQKDFFGKEFVVGAEGYSGSASKGVTEDLFFEVWAARLDNNYNTGVVRIPCFITVEYDAVFTEPKTLSAS